MARSPIPGARRLLLPGALTLALGGVALGGVALAAPAGAQPGTQPTTTVLSASTTTPVIGQTVTYTAVVSVNPPDTGTPTGTVTFTDTDGDTAPCAAQPLTTSGTIEATCSLQYVSVGGDSMVAQYNGDETNAASTSSPVAVTINQASTAIQLGSSGQPSRSGRQVAFHSQVAPVAPGAGVPTGTVTFSITGNAGGTATCTGGDTVTLVDGRAVCRVAAGTLQAAQSPYTVVENYSGDADFQPSGNERTQDVNPLPSRTSLSSSANPSVPGASLTVTAMVRPRPLSTPEPQSGTVTFTNTLAGAGPPPECQGGDTVTLFAGQAACTVSGLTHAASPYKFAAAYSGDTDNLPSTSRPLRQRVG